MKFKAYNKYTTQHLIIEFNEDSVSLSGYSSSRASGSVRLEVLIDDQYYKDHPDEYAEDPDLERWSDLVDIEVVEERP